MGFAARLGLWSGTVLMALATAAVAHEVSGRVAHACNWSRLPREALRLFLVVLLFSPIAYLTVKILGGSETPLSAPGFLKAVFYVAFSALGLRLLNALFPPLGRPATGREEGAALPGAPHEAAPVLNEPRLYRRLPDGFPGPILRLNGQDHFVEVVAADASVSIRMRLSDAIAEMEPMEGIVPHRSHWVLKEAVTGSLHNGARVELCLRNGDRVPVSRSARKSLEEAGLL